MRRSSRSRGARRTSSSGASSSPSLQLAMDGDEAYKWVKYIYIDDPISSLDEQNAVAGRAPPGADAQGRRPPRCEMVVSTHHLLFFNVLCNEHRTKRASSSCCGSPVGAAGVIACATPATPRSSITLPRWSSCTRRHEVGQIFTHHFNMMRRHRGEDGQLSRLRAVGTMHQAEDDDDRMGRSTSG